jgi:hypothetical protein
MTRYPRVAIAPTLLNAIPRRWLVRWIYLAVAAHLVAGVLLPLLAGTTLFAPYQRAISAYFLGPDVSPGALALQAWWMALLGATVQAAAIWMAGLAVMGDQQRNAFAWAALMLGLVVWGPQDMLISARAQCWPNLWFDAAALLLMLPPLAWLCRIDLAARRMGS